MMPPSTSLSSRRRLSAMPSTKADPNAAINESQPVATALEHSTLGSLRSMSFTDIYGKPINDPDLSNPTRPRWERPLDTIRSFDAEIERSWKEKRGYPRAESRPPSHFNGFGSNRNSLLRKSNHSYHRDSRHSSPFAMGQGYGRHLQHSSSLHYQHSAYGREPYQSEYIGGYDSAGGSGRLLRGPPPPGSRIYREPVMSGMHPAKHVYPVPGYHRSRDTVSTRESNGSHSEPWANSTEPSSENSSIDKVSPMIAFHEASASSSGVAAVSDRAPSSPYMYPYPYPSEDRSYSPLPPRPRPPPHEVNAARVGDSNYAAATPAASGGPQQAGAPSHAGLSRMMPAMAMGPVARDSNAGILTAASMAQAQQISAGPSALAVPPPPPQPQPQPQPQDGQNAKLTRAAAGAGPGGAEASGMFGGLQKKVPTLRRKNWFWRISSER